MASPRQILARIQTDILDAQVDAERRVQAHIRAQRGRSSGIATLDMNGKLPDEQIADTITRDTELNAYSLTTHTHILPDAWPVNSIFLGFADTDPATLLERGEWELLGTGILTIGVATPTVWAWRRLR